MACFGIFFTEIYSCTAAKSFSVCFVYKLIKSKLSQCAALVNYRDKLIKLIPVILNREKKYSQKEVRWRIWH